jgi:hypothetical protein
MLKTTDLIKEFRSNLSSTASAKPVETEIRNFTKRNRRRKSFLAFCAALFTLTGTWFVAGSDIRSVVAQESAAEFFRRDQARMRGSTATQSRGSVPFLSIFRDRRQADGASNRRADRQRRQRADARKTAKGVTFARAADRKLVAKLQKTPGFQPTEEGSRYNLGTRSVCVRLCDGFSFPVGSLDRKGDIRAHEAICSGLCPGSPTALYVMAPGAQDISEAVSARSRKPYAALPIALSYTAKKNNTCSCRAPQQPHLALVSLRKDFTLRKGDAVMTSNGMRIFRGAKRWPYRQRDFVSLSKSRRMLPRSTRSTLGAMEQASSRRFVVRQATQRLKARQTVMSDAPAALSSMPLPPHRPQKLAKR